MTAPIPLTTAQILGYTPSPYQQAIFDTVKAIVEKRSEVTYIVVDAVPGSGKTFTIVRVAYDYIPRTETILFCTFIKELSKELSDKVLPDPEKGKEGLPNATVMNMHVIGRAALANHLGKDLWIGDTRKDASPNAKQWRLADRYINEHFPNLISYRKPGSNRVYLTDEGRIVKDAICELYTTCKLTLTDPNDTRELIAVARHYGIDFDDRAINAIPTVMQWGEQEAVEQHIIDFDDMLYLPVKWDLPMQQYDWVLCDESQDLSRVQLELALKCRKPVGRMVFVGDKNQAIMGFAKADNRSLENIIERTQATVLPLSICYRCPTSIIERAKEIVPHIEAREGAPVGEITILPADKLHEYARPGDLIISRTSAELIEECIRFIKAGKRAKVKGRDIGTSLTSIVKKLAKRDGFTYDDLLQYLFDYRTQQVNMMQAKEIDESAILKFTDRCDGVAACYENYRDETEDIEGLNAKIADLFDDKKAPIQLSTIHKAKGLEAKNVFILAPDKLPMIQSKDEIPTENEIWQAIQEWNIFYVAITRVIEHLYVVGGPLRRGPHAQNSPPKPQSPETSTPTADVPNLVTKGSTDSPSAQIAAHSANDAQQDPPMLSKKDRERAELRRLFERKPETSSQRIDRVLGEAHHKHPNLPIDEAINAATQKRVQDAQKGTQERRGPKHDVNPAGSSGGIKTREMLRHQSLFDKIQEATGGDDPNLEPLDPEYVKGLQVAQGVKELMEEQQRQNDAALLDQLNNLPDITPPTKSSPLDEIEKKIAELQDLGNRQNALEALEILRDIFG